MRESILSSAEQGQLFELQMLYSFVANSAITTYLYYYIIFIVWSYSDDALVNNTLSEPG